MGDIRSETGVGQSPWKECVLRLLWGVQGPWALGRGSPGGREDGREEGSVTLVRRAPVRRELQEEGDSTGEKLDNHGGPREPPRGPVAEVSEDR